MQNKKTQTYAYPKKDELIILGIDPGTARMGYGIIKEKDRSIECLEYGILSTESGIEQHIRLRDLYEGLEGLIKKYEPDAVAVEDIFFTNNQKTIIQVSQARGIALLASARKHKKTFSFTPLQIKQAVTSYGKADKKQVQDMVKVLLGLEKHPKPDDAADALAVAICCAHSWPTLNLSL